MVKQTETITCVRDAQVVTDDRDYIYPPADVTVATSAGTYVVSVPDDEIFGPKSKREAGALKIRLDTEIDGLTKQIDELKQSMNNVKIESKNFYFGEHNLPGDIGKIFTQRFGCDYWHNKERMKKFWEEAPEMFCKGADKSKLVHSHVRNGNECGYNFFTMMCVTF